MSDTRPTSFTIVTRPRGVVAGGFDLFLVDSDDRDVAKIIHRDRESLQTQKTAHLLATAPELLRDLNDALGEIELCRGVLKDYARGIRTSPVLAINRIEVAGQVADNARASIAKAEGLT